MAGVREAIKQFHSLVTKQGVRLTEKIVEGVQDAITEAPKEIATQVLARSQKKTKGGKALKKSLFERIPGWIRH